MSKNTGINPNESIITPKSTDPSAFPKATLAEINPRSKPLSLSLA